MIRNYLKQAWALLRQNPLFSALYVAGTGVSVALTMALFVIFYVKVAPIYPEYNRPRMLCLTSICAYEKDNLENVYGGMLNYDVADLLDSLPHLDAMGITHTFDFVINSVSLPGQKSQFRVRPMYVNEGFWRVFTFRFVDGLPFVEADNQARRPVAVVSASLAKRLFATTEASGKTFLFRGRPYTVAGVVQDVSSATPQAAADLWLPLLIAPWATQASGNRPDLLRGSLKYYLTALTPEDKPLLKQEVIDAFARFDRQGSFVHQLLGQPDDSWVASMRTDSTAAPDVPGLLRTLAFVVAALLFIPAVNLSGMIASRMDQRTAELGIRKAYGATTRLLLGQVLTENLLLTCLGGLVGLLLCLLLVATSAGWILTLFDAGADINLPVPFLTVEMLLNPWVFLGALGLCLVLNVVSALLPAWLGLRHTIVQELYTKR